MSFAARFALLVFVLLGSGLACPPSRAGVSEVEAARLGGPELTPMGAERAGTADGRIPEWTGGLPLAEDGVPDNRPPDPFADDEVLFTISAENWQEHEAHLSEGQKALLQAYPDTWYMRVFPTRRSASFPEWVYEGIRENATHAEVIEEGKGGVRGASVGSPFPIPTRGIEVVWNHILRFRAVRVQRRNGAAAVTRRGRFSLILTLQDQAVPYAAPSEAAFGKKFPNTALAVKQKVISPSLVSGNGFLLIEPIDQTRDPRKAWQYLASLRRVVRLPHFAYDFPASGSENLRTTDELDMYNGAPDRFEWKLVGKREMYIPYNAYALDSSQIDAKDIIRKGHINPELARYELHRVWVVEGQLRPGMKHVYGRRVFYLDEDSWQIGVTDSYDRRAQLWRVAELHPLNYTQVPTQWTTLEVFHDLSDGRFFVNGIDNWAVGPEFSDGGDPREFSPNALLYYIR